MRLPACSSLTPCPRWHGQLLRRLPGPGVGPGAHQGRHRLRCGGKRGPVRHSSAPALRYPRWVSAQPLQLGLHGSAVCKCTGPCPTSKDVKRTHFFREGTQSLIHLCFPIKRIKNPTCILSFKKHSMDTKYPSHFQHEICNNHPNSPVGLFTPISRELAEISTATFYTYPAIPQAQRPMTQALLSRPCTIA